MRFDSQLSRLNCQTFSTGLSSGHLGGSGSRVMLAGDDETRREMPAGLIEQQHGMRTRRHGGGDLGDVQRHAFGVAAGQDKRCALALGWTDGTIDIRRGRALVLGRRWSCSPPRPAAGDAVLLVDPRLVLPPQLYGCAKGERRPDRCHLGGEVFLKAGMASAS